MSTRYEIGLALEPAFTSRVYRARAVDLWPVRQLGRRNEHGLRGGGRFFPVH